MTPPSPQQQQQTPPFSEQRACRPSPLVPVVVPLEDNLVSACHHHYRHHHYHHHHDLEQGTSTVSLSMGEQCCDNHDNNLLLTRSTDEEQDEEDEEEEQDEEEEEEPNQESQRLLHHHDHHDHYYRQQEECATRRQARMALRLKMLLATVLVTAAACSAWAVYRYIRRAETQEFQNQFGAYAQNVRTAIGTSVQVTLGATDALAVNILSHAAVTNATWPFVTVPNFYVRTQKIQGLSHAVWTTLYHYVADRPQRALWEAYTATHNDWIDDDIAVQATDANFHGPIITEYQNYNVIHGWGEYSKSPDEAGTVGTDKDGPYWVNWQNAPVIPRYPVYNWDILSLINPASIQAVYQYHRTILAEPYLLPDPHDPDQVAEAQVTADWFSDYIAPSDDPHEPVSDIFYPLYNDLSRVTLTTAQRNNETLVAIMAISIYWRDLLRDTGARNVVVVIENACAPTFSYEIQDGARRVQYLGRGDHHDAHYSHLGQQASLQELMTNHHQNSNNNDDGGGDDNTGRGFTGVPLNEDYCPFTIRIYPSRAMEARYTSNKAIVLAIVAALIFVFASIVFIGYDVTVSATMTTLGALVAQRTTALEHSNQRLSKANQRICQAAAAQLQHFAMMSHEIRTPLNCIIGVASLLEHDSGSGSGAGQPPQPQQSSSPQSPPPRKDPSRGNHMNDKSSPSTSSSMMNPQQREAVSMIVQSGNLLRVIIDDVLDYTKLESGGFDVELLDTPLQQVLDGVVPALQAKAQQSAQNISLRTIYDPSVPDQLRTDPRRLQQILYNLLGNAVKFSRPGGTVELSMTSLSRTDPNHSMPPSAYSPSSEPSLRPDTVSDPSPGGIGGPETRFTKTTITTDENTGKKSFKEMQPSHILRIAVKDYGAGIPKEAFDTIFRPFSQAIDRSLETSNPTYGGTGLGLAITFKLVECLGGRVYVESEHGNWSKFTVDLPLHPSSSENGEISLDCLAERTIVMVCREAGLTEQMSHVFQNHGIDFIDAESIEAAQRVAASCKGEKLFLLDENLFDADVFERDVSLRHCPFMTFGPDFAVPSSRLHIRSLEQVLPSLLIRQLSNLILEFKSRLSETSTPTTTTALNSSSSDSHQSFEFSTLSIEHDNSESFHTNPYQPLRILIAEDNMVNQKVLRRILERIGVESIDVVANGRLAMEREAVNEYDLVLMDNQMPEMDGIQACRAICRRRQERGAQYPLVIFVTAHVSDSFRVQCLEAGGHSFLAKPCSLQTVQKAIEDAVAHRFDSS